MSKKKKIVFHSNHCRMKTGFGKHMKHLMSYLYKTGKYEIVEFANGNQWYDKKLSTLPWKAFGSLPNNPAIIEEIKSDNQKTRMAGYGHYTIDTLIEQEKPDIYLGIEDIWGVEGFWKKNWWNKINSIIWTPIDSLPLLDKHKDAAKFTKDIIVQASFAHKALSNESNNNVHLMPVPIDTDNFFKLDKNESKSLRSQNNISENDFIIGFVFRNQLRKSVPNLLDGFKIFIEKNPNSNAKLLFHTHWGEGWDIPRLLKEKGIDPSLVLTTYYCDRCHKYEVKPFSGQDLNCKFCGSEKSQQTSQVNRGVSEKQLNEIYNLMDVYCHPFTSGGQEIPIQEAKLTELITLVTNYSCGEDYCTDESGGLPLDWSEYREPGTQFIKASTSANDIASQLLKVYNMPQKQKSKMGKKARDFVVDFCSIDSVCSKFEKLIDSMDPTDWDFDFSYKTKNAEYELKDIADDRDWVIDLYKNVLNMEDPELEDPNGIFHWVHRLKNDLNRNHVYQYFIKSAIEENNKNQKVSFETLLDKDDEGKRILFCCPGTKNDVLMSTALLKYIKDKHKEKNIYFSSNIENEEILQGNPYIHKFVPYDKVMENHSWSEGKGDYNGMFEFVLMPHTNANVMRNYIHANKHKIEYNLDYA